MIRKHSMTVILALTGAGALTVLFSCCQTKPAEVEGSEKATDISPQAAPEPVRPAGENPPFFKPQPPAGTGQQKQEKVIPIEELKPRPGADRRSTVIVHDDRRPVQILAL